MNFTHELEQIKALQKIHASGTSLISYYISGGADYGSCTSLITKELGTASNIKSKSTRKDVQSALRSIQGFLKGIKRIPQNGIAIFAGNQSLV